jgi:hypothetical protein
LRRPQTFSFSSGRIFIWDPKGSRCLLFSRQCKKRLDFWIANGRPRMFLSVDDGKLGKKITIASLRPQFHLLFWQTAVKTEKKTCI